MVLLCGCELQIKHTQHNDDDSVNVPQENVSIESVRYSLFGTLHVFDLPGTNKQCVQTWSGDVQCWDREPYH